MKFQAKRKSWPWDQPHIQNMSWRYYPLTIHSNQSWRIWEAKDNYILLNNQLENYHYKITIWIFSYLYLDHKGYYPHTSYSIENTLFRDHGYECRINHIFHKKSGKDITLSSNQISIRGE